MMVWCVCLVVLVVTPLAMDMTAGELVYVRDDEQNQVSCSFNAASSLVILSHPSVRTNSLKSVNLKWVLNLDCPHVCGGCGGGVL